MKYTNLKVEDLIEELKGLPQKAPLQIVYFNEDTPDKRIECDIHDCVRYGNYIVDPEEDPAVFNIKFISLELVGRNTPCEE